MPEYINKTKFLEQLRQELSEIGMVHHDHINLEKQMYEFAIKKVEEMECEDIEIIKLHKTSQVDVGQIIYVITKYVPSSPYEIIKCKVNRKTVKKKSTFSASGCYSNGSYYGGTFNNNSVGKKVFFTVDEAVKECERLNNIS